MRGSNNMAESHDGNRALLRPLVGIVGALLSFSTTPILAVAQDQIGVVAPPGLDTSSASRSGPLLKASPEAKTPQLVQPGHQKASSPSTRNSIGMATTAPQSATAIRSGEQSNTAPFQKIISAPASSGASRVQIPNRSIINGTGITHPGSGPGTVTGSARPGTAINGAFIHPKH